MHTFLINKMKTKKAQLKIQQTTFMLLAVTLFFILVFLFYVAIKVVNLEQSAVEANRNKAAGLVAKLSASPEFIFDDKTRAVDADKLMILKSENRYLSNEGIYSSTFWGVKGVIIEKIYPAGERIECTKKNYPDCTQIKLFTESNTAPVSSFVAWCSKNSGEAVGRAYDKCDLAILMIEEAKLKDD